MPDFLVRNGFKQPRFEVQRENLDDETRNAIWNVLHRLRGMAVDKLSYRQEWEVPEVLWTNFYHKPLDDFRDDRVWSLNRNLVLSGDPLRVLHLLDYLVGSASSRDNVLSSGQWELVAQAYNKLFEKFLVGWRFVGSQLAPLDSEVEVEAVNVALTNDEVGQEARTNLQLAIEHLSRRQDPDYVASAKASISAVEYALFSATGKNKIGEAVRALEEGGLKIHPALGASWSKMYGWTSDDGIRHPLSTDKERETEVDQALAKYLLVTSAAWVSYLAEKQRQLKLGDANE